MFLHEARLNGIVLLTTWKMWSGQVGTSGYRLQGDGKVEIWFVKVPGNNVACTLTWFARKLKR